MMQKYTDNKYRTTVVCIDSYENGVLNGRFYNPYQENGERFVSAMQYLLKMNQMLDKMEFPCSFTEPRSFAPTFDVVSKPTEESSQKGKLATFALRVLFRQNASWQGVISWLEGGQEVGFRSALEMLLLMDSALGTVRTAQ